MPRLKSITPVQSAARRRNREENRSLFQVTAVLRPQLPSRFEVSNAGGKDPVQFVQPLGQPVMLIGPILLVGRVRIARDRYPGILSLGQLLPIQRVTKLPFYFDLLTEKEPKELLRGRASEIEFYVDFPFPDANYGITKQFISIFMLQAA